MNAQGSQMKCVDLFSGIGGISLALKAFGVETCKYCELDKYCRAVLKARMADGTLDVAPIHDDIKTLTELPSDAKMIAGGFPCTDISVKGNQKGIVHGKHSSLFFEMVRLLDANPQIDFVLMENVANIVNVGLDEVVEELVHKRRWRLEWKILSAAELGAPHIRKRWFGFAHREGAVLPPEVLQRVFSHRVVTPWGVEPAKRYCSRADADKKWGKRSRCLGNSVVPPVVQQAFIDLMHGDTGKYAKHDAKLHNVSITMGDYVHRFFPTPLTANTHGARTLKHARQSRELANVLIHCTETKRDFAEDDDVFGLVVPNINYVEWLMGYGKDYTSI